MNYYQSQGTPNLWFNGGHRILGASFDAATGVVYTDIIRAHSFDAAPIRVDIDDFNPTTGAVSATVTMYSTTFELTSESFHIILMEDEVPPATTGGEGSTHTTRDIYNDTISLAGTRNTAVFNHTFTIDPAWNPANLRVSAFSSPVM